MSDTPSLAPEQQSFTCRRCGSADLRIFVMDLAEGLSTYRGATASFKCRACGRMWFAELPRRQGAGKEGQDDV